MPTLPTGTPHSARLVLLINPNSNADTTAMMQSSAQEQLATDSLRVVGLTAAGTPPMITDPFALEAAVGPVLATVHEYLAGPRGSEVSAIIIGAMGDPGRAELAAGLPIPVIGIGQAAILEASNGGRRFAMATSTPELVGSLTALVQTHRRTEWFCGVELTGSGPLELAQDTEEQFRQLREAARAATARGASAVIIAGGPLSEMARRIAESEAVDIIEPVPSACRMVRDALSK